MAGKPRKLTVRQTAVLAAVERRGRPVMADLWEDFPDLQPSAIKRVLESLEKNGLVARAGDDSLVYLNGVTWWSTAGSDDEPPLLTAVRSAFEAADLGTRLSADPRTGILQLWLPLVEVEALLSGLPSAPVRRLRAVLRDLHEHGIPTRLTIDTEIAIGPEPMLAVQIDSAPTTDLEA